MSAEAIVAKFMACAMLTIPDRQAEQIRDAVLALEDVPTAELGQILRRHLPAN
jgi:hypothetical protein